LLRCQKSIILGLPDGPKNQALERHRVDFVAAGDRRGVYFWPGGSQGPPRARGLVKKKRQRSRRAAGARSDTPWADGPAIFGGYWEIEIVNKINQQKNNLITITNHTRKLKYQTLPLAIGGASVPTMTIVPHDPCCCIAPPECLYRETLRKNKVQLTKV
jgi:hypothetical protein